MQLSQKNAYLKARLALEKKSYAAIKAELDKEQAKSAPYRLALEALTNSLARYKNYRCPKYWEDVLSHLKDAEELLKNS